MKTLKTFLISDEMSRRNVLLIVLSLFCLEALPQGMAVTHLRCEGQENPLCIDRKAPAFSWQLMDGSPDMSLRNLRQTAFRIIVADDPALVKDNRGNIWDSKKVVSDVSIRVSYAGRDLDPAKTYFWKVMVWDGEGNPCRWSAPATWQTGLFRATDWHGARWIAYDTLTDAERSVPAMHSEEGTRWDGVNDVLPLLRKGFMVRKPVRKATAYVCGLGQFELSLNGRKLGDHFLDPGWTQYDKRALYVAFDLTGSLQQGNNAIGAMLGNGFYFIPGERYRKLSGAYGRPKLICRVAIQYQDGSFVDVVSDASWRTAPGPVTFSSIYGGEDYDARKLPQGWDRPFFDDRGWRQAVLTDGPPELDAQLAEPLKIFERFTPKQIVRPRPGYWVYDMGQNASGIPCLEVKGKRGAVVTITPAELLSDSGLVTQKAIGEPVYFRYTLGGSLPETWQPKFMYYGFRYLQVQGAVPAGQPNPDGLPVVTALRELHTRNAAARIGHFVCSNALFNKTFSLIDWAIQSNTASIFTDCPHREKLGWLEEAHLVGPSIRYNYDISNLVRKVVQDIRQAQTPEGLIPDIAPEYVAFDGGFRDSPEWGSSGIILPWYAYEWFGDRQLLEESYGMMTRYAGYLAGKAKDQILSFGLGDWYDIGPNPPGESQLTPRGLTSTAIYYYDLCILTRVATLLGHMADAVDYSQQAVAVRGAFNRVFFNKATKQYGTGSQTANAMAVYMGLVDTADKQAVIANIISDLRGRKYGLTSGDIGYRYLLRVLDDAGRSDIIFAMNSRSDVPGYGYQLAHGATALTESWQAYRDASNDHFMLGHLMEWFYSGVGGIRPAEGTVAFHEIEIRPEPVGDVRSAVADYGSPYGRIASRWEKRAHVFRLHVDIPVNTHATIFLPATARAVITESGKQIPTNGLIQSCGFRDGRAVYQTGSGTYRFEVRE